MPVFRKATARDAEKIAQLHVANWQLHYRGILDDFYLDHQALDDRTKVWQERLQTPDSNMLLILVEDLNQIIGFGCLFLKDDPEYGALLDNLHVAKTHSGLGIGRALMKALAAELIKRQSRLDMYLWVLKDNRSAIRFYQKLNGREKELAIEKELGKDPIKKLRYYWPDVNALILD